MKKMWKMKEQNFTWIALFFLDFWSVICGDFDEKLEEKERATMSRNFWWERKKKKRKREKEMPECRGKKQGWDGVVEDMCCTPKGRSMGIAGREKERDSIEQEREWKKKKIKSNLWAPLLKLNLFSYTYKTNALMCINVLELK